MEPISLKKLLKNIPVQGVKGSKDVEITGLTSHSKCVAPGNLFIAKKGLNCDGARFIPDAVAAGASALLTDLYNPFYPHITQIIHPDVSAIEALLAKVFYGDPAERLFLVGITGTNGKTTTSYLVRHLLAERKKNCGLIGTIEWIIGPHVFPSTQTTPDLLQNIKLFHDMALAGCASCAMEVSSHALDQGRVQAIDFDVALFTNLTQDHLDYHGTMAAYGDAKAKLFASLKKESVAVINADSPYSGQMLAACPSSVIRYGIDTVGQPSDLTASSIELTSNGMRFDVHFQGKRQRFSSSLIGRYNVYNILAATAAALVYGLPLGKIAEKLKGFAKVPGRLEPIPNDRELAVFVDYAHTDNALVNVLKTLQEIKKGRLIAVFGCGGDRDPSKRPKMGAAAERFSDLAIITSDNPRSEDPEQIIRQILTGLQKPSHALVIVDREAAIAKALHIAKPGDIVLIAGKGHENTQTFSHKTIDFDDRIIAKRFLEGDTK